MLPTIAIVGRPNVGKSTLFNVLTKSRDALVAEQAGLTRDRKVGRGKVGGMPYLVIDTGGLTDASDGIATRITQQALQAIQEANKVLFVVDGRDGLTAIDEMIAQRLRSFNIPVHLVINKTEGMQSELVNIDFHRLGFSPVHTISASHQRGIEAMMETVLSDFSVPEESEMDEAEAGIKIAIVGRPNVGKSTLVNRILGYERVIAYDQPGTTRDSIFIPFERDGQKYTLIDTAGVRRRARIADVVEKYSVLKALQAVEAAHVVIMIIDAREGMTDQDASLLGNVLDSGRALIIAVNKWDGLTQTEREQVRYTLTRKLHFIDFAEIHFISALHGTGVGHLYKSVNIAWTAAHKHISTPLLNDVLKDAITRNPPPLSHGRRIKMRYIHQGGQHPPLFVIHGSQVDSVPDAYQRYLIRFFRDTFDLQGTPIRVEFKQGENPYQGRKNVLTPHQMKKRQRLMRFVRRSK
ncbi:ribosome-associated GTPase EngA [Beggiatoa alba B18LD]|uniref:GTPase Der n=1 Tax=Beggiatoa alba B18LD TaxID=395493 RepID=I3CBX9_9GAMM|nr:ribosome biogenesis GTPase Der [Beggiatoa alba]EIJ41122.1 ribosome-associated GTPase EngA [Beggiatoa alba B18LD]